MLLNSQLITISQLQRLFDQGWKIVNDKVVIDVGQKVIPYNNETIVRTGNFIYIIEKA